MVQGPGTWRTADGQPVAFQEARAAWAAAAREALLEVAGHYHAVVTYAELAHEAQERTGIRTRSLMMNWIGGVLGEVAYDCARRCEPLLTALCVHQDGTVGDGYADAVNALSGVRPEDPDQHAAEERLRCYRTFGATLPPDGGRPALTTQVAQARERRARQTTVTPSRVCPTCFTQLPVSGQCDNCS